MTRIGRSRPVSNYKVHRPGVVSSSSSVAQSGSELEASVEASSIAATASGSELETAVESSSIAASASSGDLETAVEGQSISVAISSSDSATGIDSAAPAASALSSGDLESAVESSSITAAVGSSDSVTGIDAGTLAVSLSSSDLSAGVDGTYQQAVNPVSGELGVGLESGPAPPSALSSGDLESAVEADSLTAHLSSSDLETAVESQSVVGTMSVSDTDSMTGTDQSAWWRPNAPDAWDVTTGQTARTLTAGTVGDLRVIEFVTVVASKNVSSLSGGGVTTWQRAGSVNTVASASGCFSTTAQVETWYGQVTSAGTALTVTYNSSIGSTECIGVRNDYRWPSGNTYSVVASGFSQTSNTTTASPMTWPSESTTSAGQLVMGNGSTSAGGVTGSTTGYTYYLDSVSQMYHCFKVETAPPTEVEAPTMTYTGTQGWYTALTIFNAAYLPSSADTETAIESSSIAANVSSSDSMAGIESGRVAVPLGSADTEVSVDAGSVVAHVSSSDLSIGVDSSTIPAGHLSSADTSSSHHASSIVASLGSADGFTDVEGVYQQAPASRTAVVLAEDRTVVVPNDGTTVIVPFEDWTVTVPSS